MMYIETATAIKMINAEIYYKLEVNKRYILPFFKPQKVNSDDPMKGHIIIKEVKVLFKNGSYVLFGFDCIDKFGKHIFLKESYMKHDFILGKLNYRFRN